MHGSLNSRIRMRAICLGSNVALITTSQTLATMTLDIRRIIVVFSENCNSTIDPMTTTAPLYSNTNAFR